MACEKNKNSAATSAIVTGITKAASSYINSVGVSASNTDFYRDVVKVAKTMTGLGLSPTSDPVSDAANVIGLVGEMFFRKSRGDGNGGDSDSDSGDGYGERAKRALKYLKPPSVLSTVLGIHTLERTTGATATLGVRTLARGKPVGTWNGVIVRESRFTPANAKMLDRLTGGRVLDARGYYFHAGGRTWHAQSFTVNVQGTAKSLASVRSLAIPRQEHFFDRPLTLGKKEGVQQIGDDAAPRGVSVTRMIDVVKGQENPRNIPGYIGSTSRLENAAGITPLNVGKIKRAVFAAKWLLEDESERDDPAARNRNGQADERATPARSPTYTVRRGPDGRRIYTYPGQPADYYGSTGSAWPSTRTARPASYGQDLFRSEPPPSSASSGRAARPGGSKETVISSAPAAGQPARAISVDDLSKLDRFSTPDGKSHPLVVRRVVKNPITMKESAEAAYHDGDRWRMVVDDDAKTWLAEEVRDGNLKVNPAGWQEHVSF